MPNNVIIIKSRKKILAIIVKAKFERKGVEFFVPCQYPQQLGYMKHPRGHVITSHIHRPVLRKINITQEVIFIKSGKVRIDFYDEKKHYVESRIVRQGDVVFLAFGGHGFEFMNKAELIEVKQGPFLKEIQPVRFKPIAKDRVKLKI